MSTIAQKDADSFLKEGFARFPIILLYGPDEGLVAERAESIAKDTVAGDPANIMRLDGDAIAADPLLLLDEANAISMFGGMRAIRIRVGGKSLIPALEPLLKLSAKDARIILEAGDIKPSHILRDLIEKSKSSATLACYPVDSRGLAQWLDPLLSEAGLAIVSTAKQALVSSLGLDRKLSRTEVEKLILYMHGKKSISLEDVEAIITDAAALSRDQVIDAAFQGEMEVIETETRRVLADGLDAGTLLGDALRHAFLLLAILEQNEAGRTVSESIKSQRISWKREKAIEAQMKRWTESRLKTAILNLGEAVFKIRRTAALGDALAIRALWSLAISASRR